MNLLAEGVDIGGRAEPGLAPCLFAERFGRAFLKLPDAGVQPDGAFVGREQAGLQRRPGHGRAGPVTGDGRAGFERARSGEASHVSVSLAGTAQWLPDLGPRPGRRPGNEPMRAEAAVHRMSPGDGWTGIAPPGRLDGISLAWPHLLPRYAAAGPAWA